MFSSAEVREYFGTLVKIKVNPEESEASRKLASEFGVTGFPSFFIYPQNGKPIRIRQHINVGGEWVMMTPREFVRACQNAAAGKSQDDAE